MASCMSARRIGQSCTCFLLSSLKKQDGVSILSNSREKLRSKAAVKRHCRFGSLLTVIHLYLNRRLRFITSLPELVNI